MSLRLTNGAEGKEFDHVPYSPVRFCMPFSLRRPMALRSVRVESGYLVKMGGLVELADGSVKYRKQRLSVHLVVLATLCYYCLLRLTLPLICAFLHLCLPCR